MQLGLGAFEIWLIFRDRRNAINDPKDRGNRNSIIFWWSLGIVIAIFTIPNLLPGIIIFGNVTLLFATGITLNLAGIIQRFWSVQKLRRFFHSKIVVQE